SGNRGGRFWKIRYRVRTAGCAVFGALAGQRPPCNSWWLAAALVAFSAQGSRRGYPELVLVALCETPQMGESAVLRNLRNIRRLRVGGEQLVACPFQPRLAQLGRWGRVQLPRDGYLKCPRRYT